MRREKTAQSGDLVSQKLELLALFAGGRYDAPTIIAPECPPRDRSPAADGRG